MYQMLCSWEGTTNSSFLWNFLVIFFLFPNEIKIHGCGTHSYGEDYTVFIIFFSLRDQFYLALAYVINPKLSFTLFENTLLAKYWSIQSLPTYLYTWVSCMCVCVCVRGLFLKFNTIFCNWHTNLLYKITTSSIFNHSSVDFIIPHLSMYKADFTHWATRKPPQFDPG